MVLRAASVNGRLIDRFCPFCSSPATEPYRPVWGVSSAELPVEWRQFMASLT
jgi:hypothetical protein